jgi:hypothetical protein
MVVAIARKGGIIEPAVDAVFHLLSLDVGSSPAHTVLGIDGSAQNRKSAFRHVPRCQELDKAVGPVSKIQPFPRIERS